MPKTATFHFCHVDHLSMLLSRASHAMTKVEPSGPALTAENSAISNFPPSSTTGRCLAFFNHRDLRGRTTQTSEDECVCKLKFEAILLLTRYNSCRRCHAHKIKCSGERPCTKCQQLDLANECEYAARDRKVAVNERLVC
jgi:hypothetical protein